MEDNILLALFALLAASAALVPLAKAIGLGTVLGYLAAGILIGPYGLKLLTDSDTIRHIAEFGIVLMLFLIGLDLQPREVWRMRNKVIGLGLPQMLLTTLAVALAVYVSGFAFNVAIIVGLAFAMSSTAIAMQTAEQRDITRTDAGRPALPCCWCRTSPSSPSSPSCRCWRWPPPGKPSKPISPRSSPMSRTPLSGRPLSCCWPPSGPP